jgi:hypothetical protein
MPPYWKPRSTQFTKRVGDETRPRGKSSWKALAD